MIIYLFIFVYLSIYLFYLLINVNKRRKTKALRFGKKLVKWCLPTSNGGSKKETVVNKGLTNSAPYRMYCKRDRYVKSMADSCH